MIHKIVDHNLKESQVSYSLLKCPYAKLICKHLGNRTSSLEASDKLTAIVISGIKQSSSHCFHYNIIELKEAKRRFYSVYS